ncbi:MAG: OmpA family protein [Bacteroidota bacterium]
MPKDNLSGQVTDHKVGETMQKTGFLLILILLSIQGMTQNNTTRASKYISEGDAYFKSGQYLEAVPRYKAALEQDEKNLKAQYQLGECYRLMQNYESAQYYYEQIGQSLDIRFPLALFYFGLMQKLSGRYDAALKNFKDFGKFMIANDLHENDDYRFFYKQAKVEIDGCQLALNQISMVHPDREFGILEVPINSEYSDYAAFTIYDDNLVCLTSARANGKQSLIEPQFGESFANVFRFRKSESGGWQEFQTSDRFEKAINSKGGDGSGTFNREKTKFYYTNCGEELDGVCHIYLSKINNGKWSDPIPLNHNINTSDINAKHPGLTPGGDTLFFASDKEGSIGGLDIWMSLDAGNDNWGPPIHLGDEINTPFNEISPSYYPEFRTLFFASDGHRGFGGYDIYIARGSKFESAEIYNAGIPFNSYHDDIFFTLGQYMGYLSSNREVGEAIGKFDIYEFKINSKEDIIEDVSGEETIAGRNSLFTDDYNFDSSETEIINQIISRRLSSSVSNVDLILTSRQLAVYHSLSDDDLERIDRIVNARIRKMTSRMMRSIRTEDDYYYRQLSLDKRRQVDNIVFSYLEQQGLGNSVSLSKDVFQFYNNVETEEREKIDYLISEKIKNANNFRPASPTYNSFSKNEQVNLDGIAMKLIQQKKNLDELRLDMSERVFLRDQYDLAKDEDIYRALRERFITLSNENGNSIGESERDLYESLNDTELTSLKSLATTYMVSNANQLEENINNSDLEIFKGKNLDEQNKLNKLLLRLMTNLANSSTYLAETTFTESELKSAISEEAEETINNLLKMRPNLTKEQQLALRQFVNTTYDSYVSEPNGVFFDAPSAIVVTPGLRSGDPSARLSKDDLDQYDGLSYAKKRVIDNLIGLNYLEETFYDRAKKLRDEAELKRTSKAERVHIAILSKKASEQEIKEFEKKFLSAAFTHYNNLSEGRKAFFNRVVLDDAFDIRNGKYVLSERDVKVKSQLTASEKSLMERIKKFRFNNERILTENLTVEAKDIDEVPVDIISIATEEEGNKSEQIMNTRDIVAVEDLGEVRIRLPIKKIERYSEITITGQLMDERSENPLSSYPITLVAFDDEATVVEGYTDTDGFFDFTISPRAYEIRFKKMLTYEDINLTAFSVEGKKSKNKETVVNATRAFFDVNSFNLRPEVKILLDEIIVAYLNSGIKIEIESHTDNTGSPEYNLKLSKERGYSTRDYLIDNGIDKSNISVIWHGQGKPIANNNNPFGRQLNRRIDIRLIGRSEKNFGSFYLVCPGATLSRLSESFGLESDMIKSLNGIVAEPSPYQPIRIKGGRSEVDYNLVFLADINATSDFLYTVVSGDTLEGIAQKFNVPEKLLIDQNNLSSNRLTPGTQIIIYPKN